MNPCCRQSGNGGSEGIRDAVRQDMEQIGLPVLVGCSYVTHSFRVRDAGIAWGKILLER